MTQKDNKKIFKQQTANITAIEPLKRESFAAMF